MQFLDEMFKSTVKMFPNRTALIYKQAEISYLDFDIMVDKITAGLLEQNVKPGEPVMIFMPNCPEFLVCYFALINIGAIVVPLNVMYKSHELSFISEDTGANKIITIKELLDTVLSIQKQCPSLKKIICNGNSLPQGIISLDNMISRTDVNHSIKRDRGYDDIVCIIYTSGTTGKPKGATLTHRSILTNVWGLWPVNKFDENDRLICALPIYNNFGLNVVAMSAINCGAGLILIERFDAEEVLHAMENRGSCFFGTPTMFVYLLEKYNAGDYDVSSLRVVNSGGANCPEEVTRQFEDKFGAVFLNGYGQTEACGFTTLDPYDGVKKKNSVGVPIAGVWLKVVDVEGKEQPPGQVGEILEKGKVFSAHGYWQKDAVNREVFRNGWFHSGDLGYLDEDGYLYIVDRKQDLIITGGQNIYPVEVEDALYTNPKISLAAVIGINDERKGELAKAYIVLKEGEKATEKEMINYVRERIAKYKAPRVVEFVQELPQGPTGKILKRLLKEREMRK